MSDRTLTVSEAQRELPALVERVRRDGESALLVQDGVVVARLVPAEPRRLTGAELAEIWERLPHLSREEADALAADIEQARHEMPSVRDPWE